MRQVKRGSTNVSTYIMLVDEVDGSPKTGYTITNLYMQYTNNVSTPSTSTQATELFPPIPASSHADWEAVEIDSSGSPGLYRVDWPDTAFDSSGGSQVTLVVKGTGIQPAIETIQLRPYGWGDIALGDDLTAVASDVTDILDDTAEIGTAGVGLTEAGGTGDQLTAVATATALTTVDYEVGAMQLDVTAILDDTEEIGTAGAGLTEAGGTGDHLSDLGGMSTGMKAEVNTEVDAGIVTYGLDHLVSASVVGGDITDDSIIAQLVGSSPTADWDTFNNITDSLEAIRDRGDAAWATAAAADDATLVQTEIDAVTSNTVFSLDTGSTIDDTYIGCTVLIQDAGAATSKAVGIVSDYVGSTKTVTLAYDPGIFTYNVADLITIIAVPNEVSNATSLKIADAVWDETKSSHTTSGTFGEIPVTLATMSGTLTANNSMVSEIGAAGIGLTNLGGMSLNMVADTSDAVWDVTASAHDNPNTTGKILVDLEAEHTDDTLLVQTTIATSSSNTSFTLTAGSTVDDTYIGCTIIIRDTSDSNSKAVGVISDYVGSSKTVTLAYDPGVFSYFPTDTITIIAAPNEVSPSIQDQLATAIWDEQVHAGLATSSAGKRLSDIETDATTILVDTTAIKSRLPVLPTKGTALNAFPFLMISSTDHVTPITGLSAIAATRSIDGGAFAAVSPGTASEIANGLYKINLGTADMDGDTIVLRFAATGADDRIIVLVTQPTD